MINIKAKYDCRAGGYKKGDIFKVNRGNDYYSFFDSKGDYRTRPIDDFTILEDEPSPNNSPIRIVTRKEIVPGVYGNISIDVTSNKYVGVHINSNMDATELREAAHILNQIAEALEHD